MKISNNKVVSLSYELRLDNKDGEIVEICNAERPLKFIFGTGNLLPAFERNVSGLEVGNPFAFRLECEEAYGPAIDKAIVEVPISAFVIDGEIDNDLLREGNAIPMMDSNGNQLNGIVVEIKTDTVLMDFNHPLAGDALFFTGSVVDVRDATDDELAHGLQHGCCSSDDCSDCDCCN